MVPPAKTIYQLRSCLTRRPKVRPLGRLEGCAAPTVRHRVSPFAARHSVSQTRVNALMGSHLRVTSEYSRLPLVLLDSAQIVWRTCRGRPRLIPIGHDSSWPGSPRPSMS